MSSKAWAALWGCLSIAAQDLREAARLDQAGRCAEAEVLYQRALATGPPGAALLNNAGNHYLVCGQPEKARTHFERVLKAQPAHANANLQLARIEFASGAFAPAEKRLERLAARSPGDFDVLLLYGRASARAGNVAKARATLEAALRLKPEDPTCLMEAGLANAAAGDFPRAVFLLARAPDRPGVAIALARASEDAGYYGDAVIAYDRHLKANPGDALARRDRARAQAQTVSGRQQGERELDDYVAAHPSDAVGHFYWAQIFWKKDGAAARNHLQTAVKADPSLVAAHTALAWLLHREGNPEEARISLETALKLAPGDTRALDQLGVVLLSLDRPREAEAALRKAAKLAPHDADAALHLGRALIEQGKDEEGQRWLDTYQKLRPARQRDARREAGMIELAMLDPAGRRAREIERFRSMARSRPDDPLLQLQLAGLLLTDGQRDEALREYRTLAGMNGDKAVWSEAGRALASAGEHAAAQPFLERAGLPPDPDTAAIALALQGRFPEALRLVSTAEPNLNAAIVLALSGDANAAAQQLRQLQTRMPDWDRPWLAHALLLKQSGKSVEAAAKFRTAEALGAPSQARACGNLREWVSGECGKR